VIYTYKDYLHKTSHHLLFFVIYRDFSGFSQRVKSEIQAFYQVNTVILKRVINLQVFSNLGGCVSIQKKIQEEQI